ncbi:MAG TPA: DUF3455 domain-containing protein [Vicinamibacterales bacterium]|nr:DUF3455 domain-containing protein [Vicinamibacterales bacterium]
MIGRAMTIGALVLGVGVSTAAAQPSVPPGLEVPAGNEVYLQGYAAGTQNYICLSGPAGKRWQFLGPQATLFFTLQGTPPQQITTHFLSANPVEAGTARPTWQHSFDSSRVWGRALASSTDPNYVQPGAIPWLLVQATGTALGPTGGAALAETTFIHRVNTSGGVAPSTGCTAPSHEGVVALVPYTTDYVFYRASR